MSLLLPLLAQILHIGLLLAAAPTVAGALSWLDRRLIGQFGLPILSPWRDLVRLSRKTPILEDNVSVVSRLAPALSLGATLSAAALVPSFTLGMAFAPLSDVLVVVSLLAISRVATCLAALESGTALPGLAAQRSSVRAILAEPALMLAVVTLALIDGSFNLDMIASQQREGLLLPAAASAVALTAILALMLAEASEPADWLDQMASGTALAASKMSGWLRRLVWIDLIGALFLPVGMATTDGGPIAWLLGLAAWAIKIGAFLVVLSTVQRVLGRIPPRGFRDLLGVAALLALLATVMVLTSTGTV